MNKKGIIRLSAGIFILLLVSIMVFSILFSSATEKESYSVGEEIKLDLSQYEGCYIKLKTPSSFFENSCSEKFSLKFNEVGEYILDIRSNQFLERREFQVISGGSNFEQKPDILKTNANINENDVSEKIPNIKNQSNLIKIGEPVKNIKILNSEENQTLKISIQKSAENISIEKDSGESINFRERKTILNSIQNALGDSNEKSLIIEDASGELKLEYFTPGPKKNEIEISENEKQVIVSSEEGLHYERVLASTNIPEVIPINNQNLIKIYWKEENIFLDYTVKDTDNNGLIDYIEWIVPHLSIQTFNIILVTKAEHLSENKTFISNIYDEVKGLDNIWSETINSGDYVRVYFEKNLTSENDITLFPRIISGNPIIEIYEKNSVEKIAEFYPIKSNEYNTIYLTNLIGKQDVFDLKIVDGSLEFDYIVDPTAVNNPSSFSDVSNRWSSETSGYADGGGAASTTSQGAQLIYSGYGFNYSTSYTINSVRIRTDYGIQDVDDYMELQVSWNGGASWSTVTTLPNNPFETTVWTNVTSLTSWDYTKLNDTNFQVRYTSQSTKGPSTWYIDWSPVEVIYTYTPPAGQLSVTLNSPADAGGYNNLTVPFNFSASSSLPLANCSLWDNSTGIWQLNKSNSTSIVNNSYNSIEKTFNSDGFYLWNVQCCDGTSCSFSLLNRTLTLDTQAPTVYQVYPFDGFYSNSTYGVNFFYNVSDTNNINNCSLLIDSSSVATDTTITKNENQTIGYPVSDGLHNWSIKCFDGGGNFYQTANRSINVTFSPQTLDRRWYETFSGGNFVSTAEILLSNERDSSENNLSVSVGATSLYTLIDAYSPFMANNGAIVPAGTVSFSAVTTASVNNKAYLTWKLYVSGTSGDSLVCQAGDDRATGGTRITSGSGPWTDTCANTADLYLQPTDRFRLVLNVWNDNGVSIDVVHYWDNLRLSYVEFSNITSLGNIQTNLTWPLTDQSLVSGEQVNITCQAICDAGRCIDTVVYLQQNTSSSGWSSISNSGNLILNTGETNPHSLGNVSTNASYTNFTIKGNLASINNVRCYAVSDYSSYISPAIRQLTVTSANLPPTVTLYSPSNGNWSNFTTLNLQYNVSDDTNQLSNCSLYINGRYNQSNSSILVNNIFNNFTLYGLNDGNYNWTVNCSDNAGNSGQPSNFTFWIDTSFPKFDLLNPDIDEIFSKSIVDFNFTIYDNTDSTLICDLILDGIVKHNDFSADNSTLTNKTVSSIGMGDHLWNITCWDSAGNYNYSETRNFTVQDLAPNVTLYYPQNNRWLNISTFNLQYNVSDNNYLTNCSLYLNGIYNQSNSSSIINGELNNFSVNGWGDGNYNWTVNCSDDYGLSAQPSNYSFWIDTVYPTLNLTAPIYYFNSSSSSISFNFSAKDNLDSILSCNLTVNNQILNLSNAQNNTPTNISIQNLADGLKYWNVSCTDNAGNINISSTWMLNISEYPRLTLITGDNQFFNQSTINLLYSVSDNTNLSSCNLYINGIFNKSNSTAINNGGQNNFTLTTGPGKYNWSVFCNDTFNLKNQSSNRTFTIDLEFPQINLSYPPSGQSIYSSLVTFNYTVTDDVDFYPLCNLTINGVKENFTYAINGSVTSIPVNFIYGEIKYWNVTCLDDAGNLNTSEMRNFTLYLPPNVNLTYPIGYKWFNSSDITFFYNVSDGNGDIMNASILINGTLNKTNLSEIINNEVNNFTVDGLMDGFYNWTVQVGDKEGMVGVDNAEFFYIDTKKPTIQINSPYEDQIVIRNNFSLNFTLSDNLASNLTCNLSFDDYKEYVNQVFKSGINVLYLPSARSDGNYSWYVECIDSAGNYNISALTNFSVIAPPNVTLEYPAIDYRTNLSDITFRYIPYDDIGLTQCNFYLDGIFNDTETTIYKNENNTFLINGIPEGRHNWTVNCTDSDENNYAPDPKIFYRDLSPPSIVLNSPDNNSGINFNYTRVYFNLTAIDALDNAIQCNLTIDGIVRDPNFWVSNNSPLRRNVLTSVLGQGTHWWNITCWDQLKNKNTSELRMFNLTYPDLFVNSSSITLNETDIKENQSVQINATIFNLGGADAENVVVRFYNGDPETGGVQIGSNILINVTSFNQTNVSASWLAQIGNSQIFVIVDPPTITNGSFIELNETNNKASKNISVGSWHFFYGDILAFSDSVLADTGNKKLVQWEGENFVGNIYVTDYDSYISWSQLQSIGKTKSGSDSSSDFSEIDNLLNSGSYDDSVYSIYTTAGAIKQKINLYSFNKLIQEIPVANSTNNSNFLTGILWDYSDDTNGSNGEFDLANKEDLIFIAPINKSSNGTYGLYDYEIRVPAKLRQYRSGDSKTASFYVELI